MKVLYILPTGLMGGMERHVRCLALALRGAAECRVLIIGDEGPLGRTMRADGIDVVALGCRNGHDWRIFPRLHRVLREFRPDVVHAQNPILFPSLYFKSVDRRTPYLLSIHTPTRREGTLRHLLWSWLGRRVDYHLPVSSATWRNFLDVFPFAAGKGEVFFNPLRLADFSPQASARSGSGALVLGMVGRNADQKDWPSFHRVEGIVRSRRTGEVEFLNAGENAVCDGREAIAKMDLFVMTSKHEELPTTALECFALGTPICGFIPVGGMADILALSGGPLREAFVPGRDCAKLAAVALDLLAHPEKRRALAEDGRRILTRHFDAERNCRGRLMEIYCSRRRSAGRGESACAEAQGRG